MTVIGILDEPSFSLVDTADQNAIVMQVVYEAVAAEGRGVRVPEVEAVINEQAERGFCLYGLSTACLGGKGFLGGERVQATMVFKRQP